MKKNRFVSIEDAEACIIYGGRSSSGKHIAYTIGRFIGELGKALSKLISNIRNNSETGEQKTRQ